MFMVGPDQLMCDLLFQAFGCHQSMRINFLRLSHPPPSLSPSLPPSLPQVLNLSADVLRHVPDPIDYEATAKLISDDMTPLNVVLLQEVSSRQHGHTHIHKYGWQKQSKKSSHVLVYMQMIHIHNMVVSLL